MKCKAKLISFLFADLFVATIYFIVIVGVASIIQSININKYPEYKYFTKGLIAKLTGVTVFCLVYVFYYEGGDTVNYFLGSKALVGVLFQDFDKGIALIFNSDSVFK